MRFDAGRARSSVGGVWPFAAVGISLIACGAKTTDVAQGPSVWPVTNVTYGAANGILESPIVGTTTDESQNLWVATHQALYLLRVGETRLGRSTDSESL